MFDPRLLDKVLTKRDEEARESATQFAADLEGGRLDSSADGFNQGLYQLAPVPEQPPQQQQDVGEDKRTEEEEVKEEEGKAAAVAEKEEAGMCVFDGAGTERVASAAYIWSLSPISADAAADSEDAKSAATLLGSASGGAKHQQAALGESRPAAATTAAAPSDDQEKPVFAPAICWRPARVAVDLQLATRLIRK